MIYRGYTIVRELKGWQQNEINDDGSIGNVITFVEDDEAAWYCVDSKDDPNGEALSSLEAAKRWIDWRLDGKDGSTFNLSEGVAA